MKFSCVGPVNNNGIENNDENSTQMGGEDIVGDEIVDSTPDCESLYVIIFDKENYDTLVTAWALGNFVTLSDNIGVFEMPDNYKDNECYMSGFIEIIPKPHSIIYTFEVEKVFPKFQYVNGHVILNQCGSLLIHSKNFIKESAAQNRFLQALFST